MRPTISWISDIDWIGSIDAADSQSCDQFSLPNIDAYAPSIALKYRDMALEPDGRWKIVIIFFSLMYNEQCWHIQIVYKFDERT